MGARERGRLIRGLGPAAATALVAGNVIGSGIYVVPGSLAEIAGPVGLVAWLVNALGYLCLTATFADLGGAYAISGGPQAFAGRAFGPFACLEVGYLYWTCVITANAAFATGFVGYLAVFYPEVAGPVPALLVGQALLWGFCALNVIGVRAGGVVQVLTTVLKIAPLLLVAVALLGRASAANLAPFAPHGYGALLPAIALVSWLFLGSESITVPAEEVVGSGRTIRRAAYAGFGIACAVYFLVAAALTLGLPATALAGSVSPLAAAARAVLGPWGETLVTLGALVSIAGVLNGWTLVGGRLPYAAARDGVAPAALGRVHARFATPAVALVVTTLLSAGLLLLTLHRTLLEAYNFIALLSTATALVAIGGACAAELVLLRREPARFTAAQRRRGPVTATAGLLVVALMLAGTGAWVCALTALAMLVPIPYYLFLRARRGAPAGAPL